MYGDVTLCSGTSVQVWRCDVVFWYKCTGISEDLHQQQKHSLTFNVSHPVVFLKFIQDTNPSQTQQFYYIITFKATCFNYNESSSGLLQNIYNVSTFIVHSGIPKPYNRWYSQYKSTGVRDLTIGGTVNIKVHV